MTKFGIGQAVRRVEDQRFTTGTGQFVSDVVFPRQAYGISVLSPHAHAQIKKIDIANAKAASGVLCVLTGADALVDKLGDIPPHFTPKAFGGPDAFCTLRPVLPAERVRCIGERVAFVVAETELQARDAAELVVVDYEALPAVVDVEQAAAPTAPKIWNECPTGNIAATIALGDKAAVEEAFAQAEHIAKVRLVNNRITANAIEPRCSVGVYEGGQGKFTLYTSSQNPHSIRSMLASTVFRVPETKVRVISPDVGGGFGMKANIYPDDVLVLLGF